MEEEIDAATGEMVAQTLIEELAIQEINEISIADNDEELVMLSKMTADQFAMKEMNN